LESDEIASLNDINTVPMSELALMFHRNKEFALKSITDVGIKKQEVIGCNGKVIDLVSKEK
jgi:hypothetical protein